MLKKVFSIFFLFIPFVLPLSSSTVWAKYSPQASLSVNLKNKNEIETDSTYLFDDFSTEKGWIDQSLGNFYRDTTNNWLVYQTHRDYTRRRYIPINVQANNVHLEFRFKVTQVDGNGSVAIGLVENLDAPVQYAEIDATGFFLRIIGYFEDGNTNWVVPVANYQNGQWYNPWEKKINFQNINVWRKASIDLSQGNWLLRILDDSGNVIGQSGGMLPYQHNAYNYLAVIFDQVGGWETASGIIDDILISSASTNLSLSGPVLVKDITPGSGSTYVSEWAT